MLTVAPTGSTNLVMRRSTPRPSSRQRKVMGSVAELGERTPRAENKWWRWAKGGLPREHWKAKWELEQGEDGRCLIFQRPMTVRGGGELLMTQRAHSSGVPQAEGLLTHLKPIAEGYLLDTSSCHQFALTIHSQKGGKGPSELPHLRAKREVLQKTPIPHFPCLFRE